MHVNHSVFYQLRLFFALGAICTWAGTAFAQKSDLDSFRLRLSTESNDSIKAVLLNELAWQTKFRDLSESEKYCLQSIELCTRTGQIKARSSAYNTLGLVKTESNHYDEGIQFLQLAHNDKETVGDKKGLATVKNNLGVAYKNSGNPEMARKYFNEAITIHTELGNNRGLSDSYNNLGVLCRNQGLYEESNGYFMKALELKQQLNDKNGMGISYNNLFANASDQLKYTEGLEYLYKAANLFEETNNRVALVAVYGNMAKLNRNLLHPQEAIRYCKKALELGKSTGAGQNLQSIYATLGDVYFDLHQPKTALRYYTMGLKGVNYGAGGNYESHFHLGRGVCFLEEKNFEKALPEIKAAIALSRQKEEAKPLARSLQKLAKLYVDSRQLELVKKPLNEAIRLGRSNQYNDLLELCYQTYANYHDALKDNDSANVYLVKAGQLKDSMFTKDLATQFAEMQTKYETEKKETEIKLLHQREQITELELKARENRIRKQRYWLIAGIVAFVLVLVIGYFYLANQRLKARLKQEAAIKATEENERLRLARDIHDDLGSGLSKINFLSELIAQNSRQDDQQKENAAAIAETARKLVVNMRDLIWALNPRNTTLSGLVARIHEYSSDYLEDFPATLSLDFPQQVPDTNISKDSHREILMVVKESLNNIVKHSGASSVQIAAEINNSHFHLTIKDNGRGIANGLHTGNGLVNMATRIRSIGGDMETTSAPGTGTTIQVTVPLENMLNTTLVVKT